MKKSLLCVVLLAFFASSACVAGGGRKAKKSSGKEGYDIYLLIGQSNMAGRGKMILPEDTARVMEGVWLLNSDGKPEPARNPLNRYSSVRKVMKMQQIGPGTAFGEKVARATGRKVLLVVNALGGSSIRAWAKDAPMVADKGSIAVGEKQLYAEAIRRTREALPYGKLKGIIWHQGEADARNPEAYKARLSALVENLRKDLKAPDVPFIAGEIAHWRPSAAGFNEMIRTISTFVPNSDWVSAEGAGQLINDRDPHFSRDGQLLIGSRYADKALQMCYPKKGKSKRK